MHFYVPYTYTLQGRTFAEIDELYARKVPKRQWAKAQTSTDAKYASIVSVDVFRHASVVRGMSVDFRDTKSGSEKQEV